MPIDRTSRPEPQANGPHLSASGYSEKQCRPTCRSPRERRPEDQTTDAVDIEVPETRFRGRSQAFLYNTIRPHASIGYTSSRTAEYQLVVGKRVWGRFGAACYRPTSMTALVSPAHVAAHPGDLDQAMPPGLVAVGVPDTRPTARRPELHASDRKTAQIKAIQMKSFTVGRIDCDRAGAWSSMEWARSFYARRALVRHCLLVRGFVRRAVRFDDYLTTETLAGQETSHERADE